ncbi:MAG: formylglycine-generating enzyme family protein [Deltaproteobacteria bacterium]|nr:formylglycine-generating enzyme family protein [Deltaproteobacteria bacterium]
MSGPPVLGMGPASPRAARGADADFALLRAKLPEADPGMLAGLLGLGVLPPQGHAPAPERSPLPEQRPPPVAPTPMVIPWADTPFWRVVASWQPEDEAKAQEQAARAEVLQQADLGDDDLRRGAALAPVPLVPWSRIEGRLRRALVGQRPGRAPDLGAAVERLSRAEALDRLPRERRAGWPATLLVIIDRARRLEPLAADHHRLLAALRRVMGPGAVQLRELTGQGLQDAAADPRAWARGLPEAEVVLVLSDLGALRGLGSAEAGAWALLGAALRGPRRRLVALSPAGEASVAPEARAGWGLLAWSGRLRALPDDGVRAARAGQLCALLSLCSWAPPALLRALRRLLPADEADLITELDVWDSPGAHHPAGWLALPAQTLATARARLWGAPEGSPLHTLRGPAVQIVEQWAVFAPPEVRLGDAALRAVGAAVAAKAEVTSALPAEAATWVGRAVGTLRRGEGAVSAVDLAVWGERHRRALPPGWEQGPAGALLRAMYEAAAARLVTQGDRPLPPTTPTRWSIRQLGATLRLEPAPTVEDPALLAELHPGSPVGAMLIGATLTVVRDGLRGAPQAAISPIDIDLQHVKQLELDGGAEVLSLAPLRRADDGGWAAMGRDEFGLWADADFNGVVQRFRWIPPGRFRMGSADEDAHDDERPPYVVDLAEGCWLGDTPVTQALWSALSGSVSAAFRDGVSASRRPIENVSWDDIEAALCELNDAPASAVGYRLPSEAEWERACRAGTDGSTWHGPLDYVDTDGVRAPLLDRLAWYVGNSGGATQPVAQMMPNPWGLYDMLGNVWEWCYEVSHLREAKTGRNPTGVEATYEHGVFRGGSWIARARSVRSASRGALPLTARVDEVGFRLSRGRAHQSRSESKAAGGQHDQS